MPERDPLHRHLAALREADPPEHLWNRVDHARRHRTRRWQWGAGITALALAAVALLPFQPIPRPADIPEQAVAAGPVTGIDNTGARLRALDRDLQAAYRNHASEAEIAELWTMRRALLAMRDGRPVQPVRI
jgi:hypothetical protein